LYFVVSGAIATPEAQQGQTHAGGEKAHAGGGASNSPSQRASTGNEDVGLISNEEEAVAKLNANSEDIAQKIEENFEELFSVTGLQYNEVSAEVEFYRGTIGVESTILATVGTAAVSELTKIAVRELAEVAKPRLRGVFRQALRDVRIQAGRFDINVRARVVNWAREPANTTVHSTAVQQDNSTAAQQSDNSTSSATGLRDPLMLANTILLIVILVTQLIYLRP